MGPLRKDPTRSKRLFAKQSVESVMSRKYLSREDRRNVFKISKALEAMPTSERVKILGALNIDHSSLAPKSEQECRRETSSDAEAIALFRHHQQRLVLNFRKISDFLKKTIKRRG